jgi:uncharacterized protein (TIGR00255 family)
MKSMTGFGRASGELSPGCLVDVEIKSVNSRFLEVNLKTPKSLSSVIEIETRSKISKILKRGKIDVTIVIRNNLYTQNKNSTAENNLKNYQINEEVFNNYQELLHEASMIVKSRSLIEPSEGNLRFLLNSPGVVVSAQQEQYTENISPEHISNLIDLALSDLVQMRKKEGEELLLVINLVLIKFREITGSLLNFNKTSSSESVNKLREKLTALFAKTEVSIPEGLSDRLMQEIVILSDKLDIKEELDRLNSHLNQFEEKIKKSFKSDLAIGRELDFLCQELTRETNTIGSKSSNYEQSKLVVELKVLLEQLREQVQNIE